MKKNNKGFIASSLLYGLLVLFLTIILMIMATLGNRKLTMDKLKQKALDRAQSNYSYVENLRYNYEYQNINQDTWKNSVNNSGNLELSGKIDYNSQNNYLEFNNAQADGTIKNNLSEGMTTSIFFKLDNQKGTLLKLANLSVTYEQGEIDITANDEIIIITPNDITKPMNLTIVYNKDTNMIYYYLNGTRTNNDGAINTNMTDGKSLIIGDVSNFTGRIYNLKIYDYPLDTNAIQNNYNYDLKHYNIKIDWFLQNNVI